jgi:hypothetical protein
METEVKLIADPAETLYVNHPVSSYGIFCYNSKGDLFLNSDWGAFCYAWRHIGTDTFKQFLANCNASYIAQKFETNHIGSGGKRFNKTQREHIETLICELIKYLKSN